MFNYMLKLVFKGVLINAKQFMGNYLKDFCSSFSKKENLNF